MTVADLEFAWRLYRASMKPLTEELLEWDDARQKAVVERDVVSGQASVIVGGGEEAGWVHAREETDEILLGQLYVVPAMQNRGIGTQVLRRLMDEARRKDKFLTLEVMKNNRARTLYERLGFRRTGESKYKLQMTWHGGIEARPPGQRWPGCDDDIRAMVQAVVELHARTLGDDLIGVYLHGSLATGAYRRPKSDIDVLVCCERPLEVTRRWNLWKGLLAISDARPTLGDIEVSVVLDRVAGAPCHPALYELHFGNNWKEAIRSGMAEHPDPALDEDLAAHFMIARVRGIALLGPDPASTFGEVKWEDYLAAIFADFDWIVANDHILQSPHYGILNACRTIQVLTEGPGCVPDKEEAGLWALTHFPLEHRDLVNKALVAYCAEEMPPERTEEARRLGGLNWPAPALHAFRDFAKGRATALRGNRRS